MITKFSAVLKHRRTEVLGVGNSIEFITSSRNESVLWRLEKQRMFMKLQSYPWIGKEIKELLHHRSPFEKPLKLKKFKSVNSLALKPKPRRRFLCQHKSWTVGVHIGWCGGRTKRWENRWKTDLFSHKSCCGLFIDDVPQKYRNTWENLSHKKKGFCWLGGHLFVYQHKQHEAVFHLNWKKFRLTLPENNSETPNLKNQRPTDKKNWKC